MKLMNRQTAPAGRRIVAPFLVLLLCTGGAMAQDQAGYSPATPKNLTLLGIPSATAAPHGLFFASLSGSTRRAGSSSGSVDGSLALGFGLGSAEDGIGFQFTVQTTSLTNDFGDSGYLGVKAVRRIASGRVPTYVGLSVDQIGNWGDASGVDTRASVMLTSFSQLAMAGDVYPVMFTIGAGSHVRNNDTDPGLFAGVGIGLTKNVGASLAWNGENFDLGASFKIDGLDNFGFTATANDVFNDDASRRVTFTVNWFLRDAFGG
jgi:hypothetical protein